MNIFKSKKKLFFIAAIVVVVAIIFITAISNNKKDSPFYGLYLANESDVVALYGNPDKIDEYDTYFDAFYEGLSFQGVRGTLIFRYSKNSTNTMTTAEWTIYSSDFESPKEYEKACKKFIKLFTDTFESCEQVDDDYIIWRNPYSVEYCSVQIYSRRTSFQYRDDM